MTIDSVTAVLCRWLMNVAESVLPSVRVSPTGSVGRVLSGFFGIDLQSYSVWDELGFLAEPTIRSFVAPRVSGWLAAIPAERLGDTVNAYVDALVERAESNKSVNVFGVRIGANAFRDLKRMLNEQN